MIARLSRLMDGHRWSESEAGQWMSDVLDGRAAPEQIAAALGVLRLRRETAEELTGFARAILARMAEPVTAFESTMIDVCGTGGDGANTFNVSTTVAFVVAGAGVPVAKHGNRSVSSRSGSADVLEKLGVSTTLSGEQAARQIVASGFAFLFAPHFHPGLAAVGPIRKALGVRTSFNLLGPLLNPFRVRHQLVGIFDDALLEPYAQALMNLGAESALVVRGRDGLDEISVCDRTEAVVVRGDRLTRFTLDPQDVGLPMYAPEALRGGDAAENAEILTAILENRDDGARRDAVLANAGAALWIAGAANDWNDGVQQARRSIESGRAIEALKKAVTNGAR